MISSKGRSTFFAASVPLMLGAVACVAVLPANAAELDALHDRLDEQQSQIRNLERDIELAKALRAGPNPDGPIAKASTSGFSIESADGANQLRIRGAFQAQARWFADGTVPATADTLLLRRVRPSIEGTLGSIYDFRLTPDFGGGSTIILDAYLAARFKPWAVVTVGKFKPPVGLDRLQSLADTRFAERGSTSSLVPNRDIGVQLSGGIHGLQYAIGYFNGVVDGGRSDAFGDIEADTSGDWATRIFFEPFSSDGASPLRGLGLGVAATYGSTEGSVAVTLLPNYRTPGQQVFFRYRSGAEAAYANGNRVRVAPQAYYYIGSLGLLGEYVRSTQDVTRSDGSGVRSESVDHEAWQLSASWFLTGERSRYKGIAPNSTFVPGHPGRGAWELAARYHVLDIDDAVFAGGLESFADPEISASKATSIGVGVNWYLNGAVKWTLSYEHTRFDGGAGQGRDREDEEAVFGQFSIIF